MGARDELDDGHSQPGTAAAASLVGAAEAVEGPVAKRLRKAATLVADVQLDESVLLFGGELDGALTVDQCVFEQIDQRLSDPGRVGADGYGRRLDTNLPAANTARGRATTGLTDTAALISGAP